jgi:hypothetical protein
LKTRWNCAFDEKAIRWKAASMKRHSTDKRWWQDNIELCEKIDEK